MLSQEEQARLEERQAQEWLLYREQARDIRDQFNAAVQLLRERTGLPSEEINQLIAARVAENRKT